MGKGTLAATVLAILAACVSAMPVVASPITAKSDLSSIGSGVKETFLGDFAADALRSATSSDIAFVPASALRQVDLPAAGLDQAAIAAVPEATTAPANAYVTLRVKGKQILSALERSVSRLPQSFEGFLQVSGIKVVYDASKPAGSRIISVTLLSGAALNPDAQYLAAMPDTLGLGGMGYFQAWNGSDVIKTSNDALSDVLSAYALSHQPLSGQADGRLTSL